MITFHFYKNKGIVSRLIRILTMGKFSHVSIQIGNDVFEALPFYGVRQRFADKAEENTEKIGIRLAPERYTTPKGMPNYLSREKALKEHLQEIVGKGYDYRAIFSFLAKIFWFWKPKKYENTERYFCVEVCDEFFSFYVEHSHDFLSPEDFYHKVTNFKNGVIYNGIVEKIYFL